MILTLLASALGFVSSIVPQFIKILQQKQDNKQELAILDKQLEQQRIGGAQRLEEVKVEQDTVLRQALYQHDAALKSTGWVNNLRASVRPTITYLFFGLFCSVKSAALYQLLQTHTVVTALPVLWDEPTQVIFAAIISFWFGDRTLEKMRA